MKRNNRKKNLFNFGNALTRKLLFLVVMILVGVSVTNAELLNNNFFRQPIALNDNDKPAHFVVTFSPKRGATELIVSTIASAQKTIQVAAFSFTSKPIADALIQAKQRGVDVRVVIDKQRLQEKGSVYYWLKQNKIAIRANGKYRIMHDKFMIIDDNIVQTGSFNYTKAAEKDNAENVLVIYDSPALAKEYLNEWYKLWNCYNNTVG